MPSDLTLWIIFVIVSALVIGLGVWLGRGLKIRKDKEGFSLETQEAQAQATNEQSIRIADKLAIEGATVGDISGIKSEDIDTLSESKQNIEVLSEGKITDAHIGDITGIKQERQSQKDKP